MKDLESELNNAQKRLDDAEDMKLVAVEQEKAKLAAATRHLEFEKHTSDGYREVSGRFILEYFTICCVLSGL